MSEFPPTIPKSWKVEELAQRYRGGWSPRARRHPSGLIARVPRKLAAAWKAAHRKEQLDSDMAFFCKEFETKNLRPPDKTERMNLWLRACYWRIMLEQQKAYSGFLDAVRSARLAP